MERPLASLAPEAGVALLLLDGAALSLLLLSHRISHRLELTITIEHPRDVETIVRLSSKWFVAAVLLDRGGHVYRCAPLLQYMMGWSRVRVLRYARIRHWSLEELV